MGLVHRSVKFHYANLSNLTHAKDSKSLIWKGCNDICDHSFSFIFAHCSPAMSATQDVMSVWCAFEVMLHPCPVWVCEVKKPLLYWCLANEHWQKDLGHAKRSLSVARFHATLSWPQLEPLGLMTGQGGHHGNGSQVATPMMAIFMSVANTKLARKEKCANFTLVATIAPGPGQWLPTHQRNANMPSRPPIHSFSCEECTGQTCPARPPHIPTTIPPPRYAMRTGHSSAEEMSAVYDLVVLKSHGRFRSDLPFAKLALLILSANCACNLNLNQKKFGVEH